MELTTALINEELEELKNAHQSAIKVLFSTLKFLDRNLKNQAAEVSQTELENRLQVLKNELESKKSQLETEKANQKNLAEKILKLQESVSEVRETLVKQEIEQNEFMQKVDENEKELKSLGEHEYRLNQDRISLKFGLKFR